MRINAIAAAIVLGLSSAAVHADDNSGKFYVVGSVGMAKYDLGDVEDYYSELAADFASMGAETSTADTDDSAVTFALGAGFQFNQYVAAEIFYRNYGEASAGVHAAGGGDYYDEEDKLKVSGIGVGLVGSWPLTPEFSIFGRIDAVSLKAEAEYSLNESLTPAVDGSSADDTNFKVGLGIGAQYNFGSGFAIRGEYQRIEAEIEGDGASFTSDIDGLSLSVLKAF